MQDERHEKLKAIRDEVVAGKDLPLYQDRIANGNLPVIGEGNHYATLMFIGEGPGAKEAETGRPFVGRAGQLLDELLQSIDVPRKDVYIGNILKDRPPKNRDPLPHEILAYVPFLERQIEIIQPKVLVALGRFAMKFLLDKYDCPEKEMTITELHGKIIKTGRASGGVIIVPMYHPAAAIYTQSLKPTLFEDFKILKRYV